MPILYVWCIIILNSNIFFLAFSFYFIRLFSHSSVQFQYIHSFILLIHSFNSFIMSRVCTFLLFLFYLFAINWFNCLFSYSIIIIVIIFHPPLWFYVYLIVNNITNCIFPITLAFRTPVPSTTVTYQLNWIEMNWIEFLV